VTDDLRTQIRRACAEADGFTFDSLEPHDYQQHANKLLATVPAEINQAVRAVQGWMALDLHMALGKPVDHSASTTHQGNDSWADWWASLCAEVRTRQALDGPPDRSTAAAIDETYCYEPPKCQCGHGAEYHGPEAGCIECRCAATLIKAAQADDERTTPNNPPTSSDTVDLSGHDVRCPSCRELLGQFIKTEAQAGVLVADHTC